MLRIPLILLVAITTASPVPAQSDRLGSIDFPTSGPPDAQPHLLRGLAALHSFWRPEAVEAFREAQRIAPDFAMAYWGEALAYDGVWGTGHDSAAAVAALNRLAATPEARLAKAPTERERAYLAAIERLYRGANDELDRARAYAEAMAHLVRWFPEDTEAKVLLARALLASVDVWRYKDQATLLKAGAVAKEVLDLNPRHPGAAHYVIHAFDSPQQALRALEAARTYAEIAPASSHAVHMPSHIFFQLGMWDEAATTNRRAFQVSNDWVRRRGLGDGHLDYHAIEFLFYAHLQRGRHTAALDTLRLLQRAFEGTDDWQWAGPWYYTRLASYALETGDWEVFPEPLPAEAEDPRVWYALGVHSARKGDLITARSWLDRLRVAVGEASEGSADHIRRRIASLELEALIAAVDGREEDAEHAATRAVILTGQLSPPNELPNPIHPVHELYGDVLLHLGRVARAAAQYDLALQVHPNRAPALLGRARAAARLGDHTVARDFYQQLLVQWGDADGDVGPVVEAQEYLRTSP